MYPATQRGRRSAESPRAGLAASLVAPLAVAAGLLFSGCSTETVALDGMRFACSGASDCLEGYVCESGECVSGVEADRDSDSAGTDAGTVADAGSPADAGTPPDELCSDDPALCASLGKDCGSREVSDLCGRSRTVDCGTCASPQTCGGGGVANECG